MIGSNAAVINTHLPQMTDSGDMMLYYMMAAFYCILMVWFFYLMTTDESL